MKHALLITAYKDFEQLKDLVQQFDNEFNMYIHLDKKCKISKSDFDILKNNDKVKLIEKKYTINWGGFNHLKSYLYLSEKALLNKENSCFHLITGQDYPLKGNTSFNKVISSKNNSYSDYMEYFKLSESNWKNGGLYRLEYYNFYDLFNFKTFVGERCIHLIQKIQKKINFKRSINFNQEMYGGSTYWTLSRRTLQYVVNFKKHNPKFFKRFRFTFCAEEMYFQTIIMNSEFAKNVTNDNLRYIDWENAKNGSPAYLNENHYDSLVKSNKLFARKIDSEQTKLKRMLKNNRMNNVFMAENI